VARPAAAALAGWLLLAAALPAAAGGPRWLTHEQLRRAGAAADLPAVIFFSAPWCYLCKKMQRLVFADGRVEQALARDWRAVKVDVTAQPRLAEVYQVRDLPVLLFLDPHGRPVLRLAGYLTVERLLAALGYVAGGFHRDRSFEAYLAAPPPSPSRRP
jgi:thiol:disulfide interchange protein DsbD